MSSFQIPSPYIRHNQQCREESTLVAPEHRYDTGEEQASTFASRKYLLGFGGVSMLLATCIVAGTLVGGAIADFMLAGVQVMPFAVLAFLAYLALYHTWARLVSIIWLGIVLFGLAGVALLLTLALFFSQSGVLSPSGGTPNLAAPVLPPGGAARLGLVALWNGVGLVVAGLALLPAARRNAARLLPIEPSRHVHGIALSLVLGATMINLGQLLALGGRPSMLEMVALIPEQSATQQLLGIVYPFLWNVPGAIIAAGWPVARRFRGAVRRLGLVRPTVRWIATGIVVGLAMVVGATVLDTAISAIWNILGWERTDMSAFENLLGAAMSPVGAVLIGVTAGLGEEMIIRGALQPRLGIILSNLFFTNLHAYQYSWDGLLSVFVVGAVLGVVRARSNTTTSSVAHGVYNFTLVMISVLGLSQ
jgi:uncharacterized protein